MNLLQVEHLRVDFPGSRTGWRGSAGIVRAVDDVSLEVAAGETLGVVGESGCGKTTLGRAVARLLEPSAGRVRLAGEDLTAMEGASLRARRRHFQMIFQDPLGSLNPCMTVEAIVGEALDLHGSVPDPGTRHDQLSALLRSVGLGAEHLRRYPHEFSGGQRQRIGIARALAVDPRLLVCDEPVSALDVSVQAQIVNLLQDLQTQRGLAYLFIAHDLAVVVHVSRRILVMYCGRVMEVGEARRVTRTPQHPYTQALVAAVPSVDAPSGRRRLLVSGEPPSPLSPPTGCPFHPRCSLATARCRAERPELRQTSPGHWTACHLV